MLKDDIMKLLNTFFEKGKIPLRINSMFLYRPVFHEQPFDKLEVVHEAKRLPFCNPLFIEFEVEHNEHRYEYQLRCGNDKGKFMLKLCRLKMCDIFPNENAKELEINMENNVNFVAKILLLALNLFARDEA